MHTTARHASEVTGASVILQILTTVGTTAACILSLRKSKLQTSLIKKTLKYQKSTEWDEICKCRTALLDFREMEETEMNSFRVLLNVNIAIGIVTHFLKQNMCLSD